jgi:hypothetical protein
MTAWSGDWQQRITERVRARGFETVGDFIEVHPNVDLVDVANDLGPDDVAADQLLRMYRREASASSPAYERFARSCLARHIVRWLPQGWGSNASGRAHAYSAWSVDVGEEYFDAVDRVFDALVESAPRGWLPEGTDDPILMRAFEHWPEPSGKTHG